VFQLDILPLVYRTTVSAYASHEPVSRHGSAVKRPVSRTATLPPYAAAGLPSSRYGLLRRKSP